MISILIPCHNEEENISLLIKKISRILKKKKYEIIVLDDGSTDNTYKVVKRYNHNKLKIIRSKKRIGKTYILDFGLKLSKYNNIFIIDGDLQYHPKYILEFLKFSKHYDVVNAVRNKKNYNYFFNISSLIYDFLLFITFGSKSKDHFSGLKFFKKDKIVFQKKGLIRYIIIIANQNKLKIKETKIVYQDRKSGISKYSFFNRSKLFIYDYLKLLLFMKISVGIKLILLIVLIIIINHAIFQ